MKWKQVEDKAVCNFWECPECLDIAEINPDFYQDNGTPVCTECDTEMKYKWTYVLT